MKRIKKFYGEASKERYPDSNDYVIIDARTLKEAQEIVDKNNLSDIITNVTSKKPTQSHKILGIFTEKLI